MFTYQGETHAYNLTMTPPEGLICAKQLSVICVQLSAFCKELHMKQNLIYVIAGCVLINSLTVTQAITSHPIDALKAARASIFYNKINKLQAAELLEKIITDGQMRRIMLKYVGVDPRILSTVNVDQINIKFKKFDNFSRKPVSWSRGGERMKDFKAKWKVITNLTAASVIDDGVKYFSLRLFKKNAPTEVEIPLDLSPAGYSQDDVLLATLILMGDMRPTTSSASDLPIPPTPPTEIISPTPKPPPTEASLFILPTPRPRITPTPTATPPPIVLVNVEQCIPPKEPTTTRIKLELLKSLYEDGLIGDEVYQEKMRAVMKDF